MALAIANLWKQKLGARSSSPIRSGKPISTAARAASLSDPLLLGADYNDPSAFLGLWGSHHSGNMARFANAGYDALLAKAANSQDPVNGPVCSMRPKPYCRTRRPSPHLSVHQRPADQALAQGLSHQQSGRRGLQPPALPRQTLTLWGPAMTPLSSPVHAQVFGIECRPFRQSRPQSPMLLCAIY